jgi:alkylation response protein AidB-like acyl-CoA dehydrogenase
MLDAGEEALPTLWKDICQVGWAGLHVPEAYGGSGYGIMELAVVAEEMGRVVAPGPFLPTVIASAVVTACGTGEQKEQLLPGLADGSTPAGLGLSGSLRSADLPLTGDAGVVLGANLASVIMVPLGGDMVVVRTGHPGLEVIPAASLDRGRRVGRVRLRDVWAPDVEVLAGGLAVARRIARTLAAAEAAGGASACTDQATGYAKVRTAFGRPIGQFQAVKHHCANMFAQSQMALAAAWDAARHAWNAEQGDLSTAVSTAIALPAFLLCSRLNIQVHGGIGFTYEHDAHLFLRRAMSLIALFGPVEAAREMVLQQAMAGRRPITKLAVHADEEETRRAARTFRDRYESLPQSDRREALVDSGFLMPPLAAAMGSCRNSAPATCYRRGAGRHSEKRSRWLVGAHTVSSGHTRTATAMSPTGARRVDRNLPAVQRTRCRLRPGVAEDAGRAG